MELKKLEEANSLLKKIDAIKREIENLEDCIGSEISDLSVQIKNGKKDFLINNGLARETIEFVKGFLNEKLEKMKLEFTNL